MTWEWSRQCVPARGRHLFGEDKARATCGESANAPGLSWRWLRSSLQTKRFASASMPPACPVEAHAPCYEPVCSVERNNPPGKPVAFGGAQDLVVAASVTIHRAGRWHLGVSGQPS